MNRLPVSNKHLIRNAEGFTLIELMVVMVIIALLAALVMPKFFGHVDKALQQGDNHPVHFIEKRGSGSSCPGNREIHIE